MPEEPRSRPNRKIIHNETMLGLVFIMLPLLQAAIIAHIIFSGIRNSVNLLTIDDTYYYLQTAWNLKLTGWITFDQINPTNGVQFLWFGLLYILSYFAETKSSYHNLVLSVSLFFSCASYLLIYKTIYLSQHESRGQIALLAAGAWFITCMLTPSYSFSGMESSLHGLIAWTTLYIAARIALNANDNRRVSRWEIILLVFLLIFNAWARLDSGLYSAIIFISLLVYIYRIRDKSPSPWLSRLFEYRFGAFVFLLIFSAIIIQLSFYYVAGGVPFPVSGLVKMDSSYVGIYSDFVETSFILFPYNLIGPEHPTLSVAGFLCFSIVSIYVLRRKNSTISQHYNFIRNIIVMVFFGMIVQFVVYFDNFDHYFKWYLSWTYVFWVIALSFFGYDAIRFLSNKSGVSTNAVTYLIILSVSIVVSSYWILIRVNKDYGVTRYDAARWIDRNIDSDAILAGWNVGEIGFFSNHRVINLDGIINSYSYYRDILYNPERFGDYLIDKNVTYVTDHKLVGFSARTISSGNYTMPEFEKDFVRNGTFSVNKELVIDNGKRIFMVYGRKKIE